MKQSSLWKSVTEVLPLNSMPALCYNCILTTRSNDGDDDDTNINDDNIRNRVTRTYVQIYEKYAQAA
jgi:hypothetical protein